MAVLPIITAPDKRLKQKSEPVESVDSEIAKLMDDMLETMYLAPGVGLAAPQIGVTKRIIVVDVGKTEEERAPHRMANPELVCTSDEFSSYEEGCLSLPDHYAEVERPAKITVGYLDENNARQLFKTKSAPEIRGWPGCTHVTSSESLHTAFIFATSQDWKAS